MRKIKPKRTNGTDFIDSNSLKLTGPLLEESFIHLINLSIREGRRWKPHKIFPVHKNKERNLLENYRPVVLVVATLSQLLSSPLVVVKDS